MCPADRNSQVGCLPALPAGTRSTSRTLVALTVPARVVWDEKGNNVPDRGGWMYNRWWRRSQNWNPGSKARLRFVADIHRRNHDST